VNPLSAVYGVSVWVRNRLYDRGILQSRRLSRPVISVGNISVGGSGKTPFVILLGELLKERGISFDVLSRGYGRKSRGVFVVDPYGPPQEFGDEPILIAKRLGCPVIVAERRYQAGLLAETKFKSQLHILDDGFQHRSTARDFDIVLITPEDLQDRLLPAGRSREPLSSLDRSNAVVLTEQMEIHAPTGKPVWHVRRGIEVSAPPARLVAFCGIAKPQKFVRQLRMEGVELAAQKFYCDHHAYTPAEVGDLLALRDRTGAGGFVTTEKDVINLGVHLGQLAPLSIARVRMELLNANDALDTILRVIENRPDTA
jgi:tetraacyldisaccharide 4'-kinase